MSNKIKNCQELIFAKIYLVLRIYNVVSASSPGTGPRSSQPIRSRSKCFHYFRFFPNQRYTYSQWGQIFTLKLHLNFYKMHDFTRYKKLTLRFQQRKSKVVFCLNKQGRHRRQGHPRQPRLGPWLDFEK